MNETERLIRVAAMAGAARALKFKEANWRATEDEVLQHISDNLNDIISRIDLR